MKYIRLLILICLYYFYCFSLVFYAFPISTKILLEIIGVIYVAYRLFGNKYKIKKEFTWIICYSIFICIWDLIISTISGYFQFHLIDYMKTPLGGIFGACLVYEYSKKVVKTEDQFLLLFIFVVFSECVITLFMSADPSIYNLAMSIQKSDMGNLVITDNEGYYRMIGLGSAVYFGVLPICAFALNSCTYLITKLQSKFLMVFVLFAFLIISVTFFFSARTSLGLVVISLIPYLLNLGKVGVKRIMGFCLVFVLLFVIGYNYIMQNFNDSMLEWAFGFIVNKDMESGSVGEVFEWLRNTSFDLFTFIIGDGCYVNPDGSYYQNVDVGWFRIIFYSGIIGVFLILFFHFKVSQFIYKYCKTRNMKMMLIMLFISYCLILVKGDTLLLSYLILFLVYYGGGIFDKRLTIVNNSSVSKSNI